MPLDFNTQKVSQDLIDTVSGVIKKDIESNRGETEAKRQEDASANTKTNRVNGSINGVLNDAPTDGTLNEDAEGSQLRSGSIVAKKPLAKGGGFFVVVKRNTSTMRGTQDKFQMYSTDKNLKVTTDHGSHPSSNGAIKGFAKSQGLIEVNIKPFPRSKRPFKKGEAKAIWSGNTGPKPSWNHLQSLMKVHEFDVFQAMDFWSQINGRPRKAIDQNKFPARRGLEGPFSLKKSGRVVYYDAKVGKYYDSTTDMYITGLPEGFDITEVKDADFLDKLLLSKDKQFSKKADLYARAKDRKSERDAKKKHDEPLTNKLKRLKKVKVKANPKTKIGYSIHGIGKGGKKTLLKKAYEASSSPGPVMKWPKIKFVQNKKKFTQADFDKAQKKQLDFKKQKGTKNESLYEGSPLQLAFQIRAALRTDAGGLSAYGLTSSQVGKIENMAKDVTFRSSSRQKQLNKILGVVRGKGSLKEKATPEMEAAANQVDAALKNATPHMNIFASGFGQGVNVNGSFQPKPLWKNKIFQNSPYFQFMLTPKAVRGESGPAEKWIVELISGHHDLTRPAKFRKYTASLEKVILKIQTWISTAKRFAIVESNDESVELDEGLSNTQFKSLFPEKGKFTKKPNWVSWEGSSSVVSVDDAEEKFIAIGFRRGASTPYSRVMIKGDDHAAITDGAGKVVVQYTPKGGIREDVDDIDEIQFPGQKTLAQKIKKTAVRIAQKSVAQNSNERTPATRKKATEKLRGVKAYRRAHRIGTKRGTRHLATEGAIDEVQFAGKRSPIQRVKKAMQRGKQTDFANRSKIAMGGGRVPMGTANADTPKEKLAKKNYQRKHGKGWPLAAESTIDEIQFAGKQSPLQKVKKAVQRGTERVKAKVKTAKAIGSAIAGTNNNSPGSVFNRTGEAPKEKLRRKTSLRAIRGDRPEMREDEKHPEMNDARDANISKAMQHIRRLQDMQTDEAIQLYKMNPKKTKTGMGKFVDDQEKRRERIKRLDQKNKQPSNKTEAVKTKAKASGSKQNFAPNAGPQDELPNRLFMRYSSRDVTNVTKVGEKWKVTERKPISNKVETILWTQKAGKWSGKKV